MDQKEMTSLGGPPSKSDPNHFKKPHHGSKPSTDHQKMFESALEKVGGFGYWQWIYTVFAGFSCVVSATNHLAVLFLASTPKFTCANWTSEVNETTGDACFTDPDKATPCHDFIFDQSEHTSSLITQWNLVCDRYYLLPILQGTYFGGVIMGDVIGGIASDAFGRRPTVLIICAIHMIFAYGAIFVRNYYLFIFVRMVIGGTAHAIWSILNVVMIEMVAVRQRTLVQMLFSTGWRVGFGILALMGYLIRDWPYLQLAIALLNLVFLTYFWVVPESPRWLLAAGRFSEAEAVMRRVANQNRTDRDPSFEGEFKDRWQNVVGAFATKIACTDEGKGRVSMWTSVKEIKHQMKEILHSRVACKTFFLLAYPWTMCGLAYYGIFLSVKLVNIDKYSLTGITCAIETIVLLFVVYPINKLGRTVSMIGAFGVGGFLGILIYFMSETSLWARPVLIIIGKTISSINFLGTGLLTREAFPTSVRNATVCFLDAFSKIGAAVAPFLVDLLSLADKGLPNLVIGALAVLAAIPFFFLPETTGRDIPESIEDMEELQQHSIVARCLRKRKVEPSKS